jgi:hypothetical protein
LSRSGAFTPRRWFHARALWPGATEGPLYAKKFVECHGFNASHFRPWFSYLVVGFCFIFFWRVITRVLWCGRPRIRSCKEVSVFGRTGVASGTLGGEPGYAPSRGHFAGLSAQAETTEKGKCRFACPSDEQRCSILECCMPAG